MKFRCERDVLVEALSTAGRAVSSRGGSLPVLAGLHFELQGNQLRLTGSDLDLTITRDVTVSGDEDGVAVIPARLVNDVVKALDEGAVNVETSGEEVRITNQRSDFSLQTIPAEEFPKLVEPSGDGGTLQAAELAEGLRQVVPAASGDDARPILTGVLLEADDGGLRLVATDSYRLAVRDLSGTSALGDGERVLVPSRALGELGRLLGLGGPDEVEFVRGDREASFTVGDTRLTTRLIEGEFPNYRNLVPTAQPNRLTVGRVALIEAVRRVKLMAREAAPVRLILKPDSLELMAITQDVGQAHEELDAKYEGVELTVAFNPEFLLDGLDVAPGDEVSLETVDALKPAVIRVTEHEDFLYLLMPVRVS